MEQLISTRICSKLLFVFFLITYISRDAISQNIPNPNFANAIRTACPSCIDGSNNLLPPAASLTSLDVSNKNISNLTGIGGFTGLLSLICSGNQLSSLPALPNNLTYLSCNENQLTTLPTLPNSLLTLSCDYNQLTSLPALPSGLKILFCQINQLTALPTLPNTLTDLYCIRNLLTSLPALPSSLKKIECRGNQLTSLPTLPNGLTELTCYANQISSLPTLPTTLTKLYLDADKVSCLPNIVMGLQVYNAFGMLITTPPVCGGGIYIPDANFAAAIRSLCPTCINASNYLLPPATSFTGLEIFSKNIQNLSGIQGFTSLLRLDCRNNLLISLPTLPSSIKQLICSNNQLTSLPTLPSGLEELLVPNTSLTNLPTLPHTLTTLVIDPSKVTCLPNQVEGLQVYMSPSDNTYQEIPTPPTCGSPCTPPTAPVATGASICSGTSISLTAAGCSGNGAVLKWYNATTNALVTMPIAPTISTNYYAKCEVTTNGTTCASSNSNTVTVTVANSTTPIASGATICLGGSASLTATGCSGMGTVLKWYNATTNALVTMPVSPTIATNYYAKCEKTTNGLTCISANSNTVMINITSSTAPVASGTTICLGSSANLTATGCTGTGAVLKWYNATTNALVTIPVSPTTNTNYYAKCEVTTNGTTCASINSNTVTVTVSSTTPPTAAGATICSGSSLTLSATGCSGMGAVLKWYNATTNVLVTMPVSPNANTNYYAKCEVTVNGTICISAASNVVAVNVATTTTPVATGASICSGSSVTLTATSCSGTGTILKWYNSANNSLVTMPVSPTATTNYYAKCEIIVNGSTCTSLPSNIVAVTIGGSALPVINYITPSINNPVPIGSIVTFRANATGTAPMTVKWQRRGPSEAIFSDINGTSQTYLSNTDATYTTDSLKTSANGVSYRAVFGSTCGDVTSPSSIIALAISQPNGTSSATLQRVKYTPASGQIADMEYSEKYGLAVAGDFDYWGINTGSLAKFDNNSDTPDLDFPRIYNIVNDVIGDGTGGWFVTGISTRGNFDSRFSINETDEPDYNLYGLIHILPDKKIDRNFKIKSHPNYPIDWSVSTIKRIVVKGGILYAYGDFNYRSFGVETISNIIAINSITGNLIPFPKLRGSGDMINVGDKLVFSASSLNTLKDSVGKVFNGLAVIDMNSLTVSEVNVNPSVPDFFAYGPLVESNGKLVVRFQHNLTAQAKLAVFDSMSVVPKWQIDLNNQNFTGHLTADNTTIYILIQDTSQGTSDFLIQALDITTGQPKSGWNIQNFRFKSTQNSSQAYPTSISISNARLFISGLFDKVNLQSITNAAMIDLGTNTLINWNPEINGTVNRIKALNTSTFLLGPSSLLIKSKQRKQIAFLNPISQELTATQLSLPTLPNGLLDKANAIAYSGDTLWVAAYSGGSTRIYGFNLIAKEQINFPSIVVNGIVRKIIVRDNLIYVQGDFSNVNVAGQSIERKGIMVFSNTGAVHPFSINVNPSLIAHIKIHDNLVYLKGNFNSVNGIVRNWFASVNRFSGALTDWNPDVVFPYQIDLTKPFEIVGNDIVFNGIVTRIGSWNNSTGNNTFFVNRITGALSKALQKGYGQAATTFESVAKEKYVFISFANESPCNGAGTGTTYWDVEKLQYAPKCISTGVDKYNYARELTFAGDKLFAAWSSSGSGRPQLLMQTNFPQGFFQGEVDYFPKVGNNAGDVTVNFYGYDIGYGTKIRLLKAGQTPITIPDSILSYPEQFRVQAILNLRGKPLGFWDLEITYPGNSKILIPNGFEIRLALPPLIRTDLIGPPVHRLNQPIKYILSITNKGEIDAHGVMLYFAINDDAECKFKFELIGRNNIPINSDSLKFIKFDSIYQKPFKGRLYWLMVNVNSQETVEIPVIITPRSNFLKLKTWTGLPVFGSPITQLSQDCNEALANTAVGILAGFEPWAPFIGCYSNVSKLLTSIEGSLLGGGKGGNPIVGDYISTITGAVFDCGISAGLAAGITLAATEGTVLAAIGTGLMMAAGLIPNLTDIGLNCADMFPDPKSEKDLQPAVIGAQDPNDKLGPVGVHSQRYITGNEPMNYLIRFENYASATAAAQYVKVIDTLDVNKFDFPTFQFGFFNVADTNFYAPPGKKKYLRDWDLRPTKNLILRMEANFNDTTGVLTATYTSLDPATMEWTEDPILGFLPPNVTAPQGEGSIFFSISPKTSLAHGTQISNRGHIYFDYNPVIPTPPWTNTLDKIEPVSQVQNLPVVSNDTTLVLHWGGSDIGAGTRLYDVYVAVNNNPYKLLVTNTGLTTINFKGKPDSTYKFYSVAVDSVGNEESAPVTFDTQTTIQLTAIDVVQSVQSGDWNNSATWNCNCVPSATQNVIIKSGHKVTLTPATGSQSCKNLTVESGAIFDAKGVFLADPR